MLFPALFIITVIAFFKMIEPVGAACGRDYRDHRSLLPFCLKICTTTFNKNCPILYIVRQGDRGCMAREFQYRDIAVETDCDHELVKGIIHELMRRRYFITMVTESKDPQIHVPLFFHIGYKGCKASILITKDMDRKWRCRVLSIKSFSKQQPPLFEIE